MFRILLCLSLFLATLPLAADDFPLSAPGTSVRQWGARSAAGGGLDLVVWEERSPERIVLKANRIGPAGAPLDGEGIVVADDGLVAPYSTAGADFAVTFDGEAFVVAWKREEGLKESLLVRTVSPTAALSEPRVIVAWDAIGALRIAGGGEGRSAISWFGRDASVIPPGGAFLAALVHGEGGTPVQLAPLFFSSATGLAAGPNGYLAVFLRPLPCHIATCAPSGPLYARSFGFDGTPTSEPLLLDTDVGDGALIVRNEESFFVAWQASVLKVDHAVTVVSQSRLARSGWISIAGDEIWIDTGIHRAVYSPGGLLRRFEPLMLQRDETYAGTISGKRVLVLTGAESARRLVVRSLETAPAADLAVVATGALQPSVRYPYERLVVFRIEHRGGAPVNRIAFWWERGWTVTVPGEITYQGGTVLDRPLREGESFEVAIPIHESFVTDDLWIAGDVVDSQPWNNVDNYARPDRRRGRAVSR